MGITRHETLLQLGTLICVTLMAVLVAWAFLALPHSSAAEQGATVNSVILDRSADFGGDRGVEQDRGGAHICSGHAHCGHLALVTIGSLGGMLGLDRQQESLASKPLHEFPAVPMPPPREAASRPDIWPV